MKDCFNRENRRLKTTKSGSAATRRTPYIYYHHLSFLNRNGELNVTDSSMQEEVAGEIEGTSQDNTQKSNKKKKKTNENEELIVGKELVQILRERNVSNQSNQFNDTEMFLLSLRKEMDKIPEYLQLQTRMKLLEVIYTAQQQNLGFMHNNSLGNRGYFTQPQPSSSLISDNRYNSVNPQPSTSDSRHTSIVSPASTISSQESYLDMYNTNDF